MTEASALATVSSTSCCVSGGVPGTSALQSRTATRATSAPVAYGTIRPRRTLPRIAPGGGSGPPPGGWSAMRSPEVVRDADRPVATEMVDLGKGPARSESTPSYVLGPLTGCAEPSPRLVGSPPRRPCPALSRSVRSSARTEPGSTAAGPDPPDREWFRHKETSMPDQSPPGGSSTATRTTSSSSS